MTTLLDHVIDAHGGPTPWQDATVIEADVTYGGPFWEYKGVPDFLGTDHVIADVHREHVILQQPSGRVIEFDRDADTLTVSCPDGRHETLYNPRASFDGYTPDSRWNVAQAGYFRAYATWSYLVEPYLFTYPGVETAEIEPWIEDGERWRGLSVTFPATLDLHNTTQLYYFDDAGLQRRIDYQPDVNGGSPTAHYDTAHGTFDGVVVTTARRIHIRNEDRTPDRSWVPITLDVTGVRLT
ncbi:hypothetical protein ACQPZA_35225 [Pseudonocardia xinjiangensis]|uniref:hypothetical protein n=1 Tax=Pseudonocardia xinjiangensis TaxID=75289 RepID=UPI003D901010